MTKKPFPNFIDQDIKNCAEVSFSFSPLSLYFSEELVEDGYFVPLCLSELIVYILFLD